MERYPEEYLWVVLSHRDEYRVEVAGDLDLDGEDLVLEGPTLSYDVAMWYARNYQVLIDLLIGLKDRLSAEQRSNSIKGREPEGE